MRAQQIYIKYTMHVKYNFEKMQKASYDLHTFFWKMPVNIKNSCINLVKFVMFRKQSFIKPEAGEKNTLIYIYGSFP